MGKKDTGRYETRPELCKAVWEIYLGTEANMSVTARQTRTTPAVVAKILTLQEGKPSAAECERLRKQWSKTP